MLCDVPPLGQDVQGGGLAIVPSLHCVGHWLELTAVATPIGQETQLFGGTAEPPNVHGCPCGQPGGVTTVAPGVGQLAQPTLVAY
jgi:hypothetical protein